MDSIFHTTRQLFQKSGLTGGPAPRPPLRMEPKGIDLHDLDYDHPKVSSKRATNTLFSKQNCTQLLENSSKPASTMNSASSPYVSKPCYTSANSMPACPDIIKSEKSSLAHSTTEQLTSAKTPDAEHQVKERKGNIVHSGGIKKIDIQFPVRQERSDMIRSFIASASTVEIHCEPTSQLKTIGPANQDEAKAPLSPLPVRNQFAAEAARGNPEMGKRSVEAYPKTNASLNKYSPLGAMEATKNPYDVAPTLVIEALTQKLSARQQIMLFTFCLLGHDENARTKITPGLSPFANSLKTMDKNERETILGAATRFIGGEEQKEQYKWVVDTLTNQ